MIIFKTKQYGLLGDRVRNAIKESGRKSSDFRNYIRERETEKMTSNRTLSNLNHQRISEGLRVNRELNKTLDMEEFVRKKLETATGDEKKLLNSLQNQLKEQRKGLDNLYKMRDKILESKLENYGARNNILEPIYTKNKYVLNSAIKEANIKKQVDAIRNTYEKVSKKYNQSSSQLRRNPNDEKLMKDIKEDFIKHGGKEEKFVIDDIDDNYFSPKELSIHLHKSSSPGIAAHENNHFKRQIEGVGIDNPGIMVRGFVLNPDNFWKKYNYVRNEELSANKRGFRDIFLNKNSGGRDWRSAAYTNKASNASYHSGLGLDIDKVGIQDLDYNMSPEALEKLKENAKKLGIKL